MLRRIVNRACRWAPLAGLALSVFALGYVGYREYYEATQHDRSVADIVYVTLQLFVVQGGDLDGPVGWRLELARFAAPAVSAYAGLFALWAMLYSHARLVRPWFIGDHVIVCGLGRKGSKLVEQLRNRGEYVVVIEHNENNDQIARCRQMGAAVLIGAANDRWLLEKAAVHRAKALISIIGDDGVNVETAVLAHELNAKRTSGSLDCAVHLFDPRLQRVLKKHRIFTDNTDPFELRFFNTFENGARAMLGRCPVAGPGAPAGPPHLLVVGLGRLGEALLAEAAAAWQQARTDPQHKLPVTVVDRHACVKKQWIPLRYPEVEPVCRVAYVEMDVHFPHFPGRVGLEGSAEVPPISAAYVCVDDDSLAMFAALALHDGLKNRQVPIIVRMTEEAGLASLLGSGENSQGLIEGVQAVGLLDVTCSLDLVLGKVSSTPPARVPKKGKR